MKSQTLSGMVDDDGLLPSSSDGVPFYMSTERREKKSRLSMDKWIRTGCCQRQPHAFHSTYPLRDTRRIVAPNNFADLKQVDWQQRCIRGGNTASIMAQQPGMQADRPNAIRIRGGDGQRGTHRSDVIQHNDRHRCTINHKAACATTPSSKYCAVASPS